MSNFYLVNLQLIIGEIEKTSKNVVVADNEKEAEVIALQGESHSDTAGFDEDGDWWDMGEMIYRVSSVIQLTDEDAATLKRLGI